MQWSHKSLLLSPCCIYKMQGKFKNSYNSKTEKVDSDTTLWRVFTSSSTPRLENYMWVQMDSYGYVVEIMILLLPLHNNLTQICNCIYFATIFIARFWTLYAWKWTIGIILFYLLSLVIITAMEFYFYVDFVCIIIFL